MLLVDKAARLFVSDVILCWLIPKVWCAAKAPLHIALLCLEDTVMMLMLGWRSNTPVKAVNQKANMYASSSSKA